MGVTVCKFGGTSLADASQIRKVADIVREDPARKFVVVSAPGKRFEGDIKVTDLLLGLEDSESYEEDYNKVIERFMEMTQELGIKYDLISGDLEETWDLLRDSKMEAVVSRGEYICAKIVAAHQGFEFVDAASFMVFSANGSFDLDATKARWERLSLPQAAGYVVPGFYGVMPDGRIKTFSRGGSDFSGAVLSAVIEADVYENWTDVSGMFSADPRVVKNPRRIEEITYRELRELTYMGATVLHDEVVFPLQKAGIPIVIKNTNAPYEEGTRIVPDRLAAPKQNGTVVGLAGRKDFTVFTLEKPLMNQELGFLVSALTVFKVHGVSVEHVPGSIDAVSIIVDGRELEDNKLERICEELVVACGIDRVKVDREVALICVVGHNMYHTPGCAADILMAIAIAGLNTRIINQCASEMSVMAGVDNKDYEAAMNAIHDRMILKT